MAYRKFDDPLARGSQASRKVYDAEKTEALRRALLASLNRVVWGTAGTSGSAVASGCGTGATGGLGFGNTLIVTINGRMGTAATRGNLEMPPGTQAKATVVKYLISTGFGTSATVTAGNEGTDGTTALLPDCPQDHVAIGYMQYTANSAYDFIRTNRAVTGGAAATAGTALFVDLVHMPLWE